MLFCNRSDLGDLTLDKPLLTDAESGRSTGVRLLRSLGAGGMSAVFLGEVEADARALWPEVTPGRLAIKLVKPSALVEYRRLNIDPEVIARKDVDALTTVHQQVPPPEFIVRCFGSGATSIRVGADEPLTIPWVALQFIDGENAGSTLRERVERTGDEGMDPVRVLKMTRGLIEGLRAFHRCGVLHRDIKPDNIFVTGAIDSEAPKIGDCGVARVERIMGRTLQAYTEEYGGPEQLLSAVRPLDRNPLVGTWSDVHALAATIWYMIGGETWYRGRAEWNGGQRRSLNTAGRTHRGFREEKNLLQELDKVLQRSAAPRLPSGTWSLAQDARYEHTARELLPAMFAHEYARFATVEELASHLLPILEQLAARWTERAAREKSPVTRFRSTRLPDSVLRSNTPRRTQTIPPPRKAVPAPVRPGAVVFLPGSDGYARAGNSIYYFGQVDPFHVEIPVPNRFRDYVRESQWLSRGPVEGFALLGPEHVLLCPQGSFLQLPLPSRADEGEIGRICGVFRDNRGLGVVTTATNDSGNALELWRSADGESWEGPRNLGTDFDVAAIASGPQALLVVGSSRGKAKEARAVRIGHGSVDEPVPLINALKGKRALVVAVAGGEGESWAAGDNLVLRFDAAGVAVEPVDRAGTPIAMELDPVGVPWLLTERCVMRRVGLGAPRWSAYYEHAADAPPLVAIGFTSMGVRLIDAMGGGVLLEPDDITAWRQ